MTGALEVMRAGPAMSVQDLGRPGYLAQGLSLGGAADVMAVHEGAALLRQSPGLACVEMAGMGGVFRATQATRIALTGAPMVAMLDGDDIAWNASHLLPMGAELAIGAGRGGYGYLHVGGGIDTKPILGSRAAHVSAGISRYLVAGDKIPIGCDAKAETGLCLSVEDRFSGGCLRVVHSQQTAFFDAEQRRAFVTEPFIRDARSNRAGIRLTHAAMRLEAKGGLSVVSDVIVPGDVQITGDGTPFVLLVECQTTGGYPRIATVLPADLARAAQAPVGAKLTFEFVSLPQAVDIQRRWIERQRALPSLAAPLVRDPANMSDLIAHQLIGGVVSAYD